jgi:hypothetical protein
LVTDEGNLNVLQTLNPGFSNALAEAVELPEAGKGKRV